MEEDFLADLDVLYRSALSQDKHNVALRVKELQAKILGYTAGHHKKIASVDVLDLSNEAVLKNLLHIVQTKLLEAPLRANLPIS